MITDAQLTFADNQALTVSAASANQVDLTTPRNLERSGARSLRLIVLVTTAFAGGTSLQATFRQSAAANMSSPDVLASGPVLITAALVRGAVLMDMPWPGFSAQVAKQFIDMNFVAVGTYSAGAVWAGVVDDSEGGTLTLGNIGR